MMIADAGLDPTACAGIIITWRASQLHIDGTQWCWR